VVPPHGSKSRASTNGRRGFGYDQASEGSSLRQSAAGGIWDLIARPRIPAFSFRNDQGPVAVRALDQRVFDHRVGVVVANPAKWSGRGRVAAASANDAYRFLIPGHGP
jgi:hypothetical protein